MSSITIAIIAFVCIFSGALFGLRVRSWLPSHHLSRETDDLVKLGAGLMATLAALILSLLVSTAKGNLDSMNSELTQVGAKVILLDRVLANYGPETKQIRGMVRASVVQVLNRIWPEDKGKQAALADVEKSANIETVEQALIGLTPSTAIQRQLQSQAIQIATDVAQARWVLVEQTQQTLPGVFLAVLLFWLTTLFIAFGMVAPNNATVVAVLLICALSLSGAIFLITEMNTPITGVIKVSSAPFQKALATIGR